MLDLFTTAVKSHHLIVRRKPPISHSATQTTQPQTTKQVTKMNTLGFYARTYIDALTIAFAPLSQVAKADTRLRDNRFTAANARAETLARAA